MAVTQNRGSCAIALSQTGTFVPSHSTGNTGTSSYGQEPAPLKVINPDGTCISAAVTPR